MAALAAAHAPDGRPDPASTARLAGGEEEEREEKEREGEGRFGGRNQGDERQDATVGKRGRGEVEADKHGGGVKIQSLQTEKERRERERTSVWELNSQNPHDLNLTGES